MRRLIFYGIFIAVCTSLMTIGGIIFFQSKSNAYEPYSYYGFVLGERVNFLECSLLKDNNQPICINDLNDRYTHIGSAYARNVYIKHPEQYALPFALESYTRLMLDKNNVAVLLSYRTSGVKNQHEVMDFLVERYGFPARLSEENGAINATWFRRDYVVQFIASNKVIGDLNGRYGIIAIKWGDASY